MDCVLTVTKLYRKIDTFWRWPNYIMKWTYSDTDKIISWKRYVCSESDQITLWNGHVRPVIKLHYEMDMFIQWPNYIMKLMCSDSDQFTSWNGHVLTLTKLYRETETFWRWLNNITKWTHSDSDQITTHQLEIFLCYMIGITLCQNIKFNLTQELSGE